MIHYKAPPQLVKVVKQIIKQEFTQVLWRKYACDVGPHGKLAVETDCLTQTLQFSLEHSSNLAINIFGWDRRVGIDLGYIRPLEDADRFAEQFYSARETARQIHCLVIKSGVCFSNSGTLSQSQ